jgi:hypothetical protein
MFALLICVYLYRRQCSWSSTNSGIPRATPPEERTHRSWRAAHAILTIATEVLGRLFPAVAFLTPTYEPMVRALMVGCTALAVRIPPGQNRDTCNATPSLEEAA